MPQIKKIPNLQKKTPNNLVWRLYTILYVINTIIWEQTEGATYSDSLIMMFKKTKKKKKEVNKNVKLNILWFYEKKKEVNKNVKL